MAMEVKLSSGSNVCEVLQIIDFIESTRFHPIFNAWRCRTSFMCDYHPGWSTQGGDFVYYDPCSRPQIDQLTA